MIELTIIGSGSALVRADRGQTAIHMNVDETHLLFDLGAGTLGRLARTGVTSDRIDGLFVTHGHPDHVAELVAYLFDIRQREGGTRTDDVVVHGPPTFDRQLEGILSPFAHWCVGDTYDVTFREMEETSVEIGSATIRSVPVHHNVPALGYRVTDAAGHVVAFTGDSGPTPRLIDLSRGADVLVADCTMGPGESFDGHMNPEQAGRLAAEAEVKTLVLSHLAPDTETVDLEGAARAEFGGQVTRARDLLSIVVG